MTLAQVVGEGVWGLLPIGDSFIPAVAAVQALEITDL